MLLKRLERYKQEISVASELSGWAAACRKIDDDMMDEFEKKPPSVAEILNLLVFIKQQDRYYRSIILRVAWTNLSGEYVRPLCEIVNDESLAPWHEQAIDLLGELSDPYAIPCLERALGYRWDNDPFLCVPRKALNVIVDINTDDSLRIVEKCLHSEEESIRIEAEEIVESWNAES